MTERTILPNKRVHEVIEFDLEGAHYVAGVGRFVDGRIAEIFIDAGKPGSPARAAARDGAILASLLLQFGVAAVDIAAALTRLDDGTAAGPIGHVLDVSLAGPAASGG